MTTPPSPLSANRRLYRPNPAKVHLAYVRDALWSPWCAEEPGWSAPIARYMGQVTCEECLASTQGGSCLPSLGEGCGNCHRCATSQEATLAERLSWGGIAAMESRQNGGSTPNPPEATVQNAPEEA